VLELADGAPTLDLPGTELVRREGSQVWLRFDPARIPVARQIFEERMGASPTASRPT
jgi:hypothetical protein